MSRSFYLGFLLLLLALTSSAYADHLSGTSMTNTYTSGGKSITGRYMSKDSMAYRNLMADGPQQIVEDYFESGCRVQIIRYWSAKKQQTVWRTDRNCP